jgi:hypothetical protein
MQRWEYQVLEVDGQEYHLNSERIYPPDLVTILNDYGDLGWELVGFEGGDYVFKRPITKTEAGE